jgi:apolipoprotein N-acyltransferase
MPPSRTKRFDVLLAVAGAIAMVASLPPVDAWGAGLVVWVPLALIASRGEPRRGAAIGWLQGALAQAATLASIPGALREAGGAPAGWSYALGALLTAYEGARFAGVGLLASRAVRNGWPLAAAFPLALVSTEWLYPMVFPWSTALFVHQAPVLLQTAEIAGPLAISMWVGFVDAALAEACRARATTAARLRWSLAACGCLAAAVAFGAIRMRSVDARMEASPPARIGFVQGNVGRPAGDFGEDPVPLYRRASLELVHRERLDLLIWPETAIRYPTEVAQLPLVVGGILRGDRESGDSSRDPDPLNVPLLAGMVLDRPPPEAPSRIRERNQDGTWKRPAELRFNSAVLADSGGEVLGLYDKTRLLAFGETIPGEDRFPWLRRLLPRAGRFAAGTSEAPLRLGARRLTALICYEDILPDRVRSAMSSGDSDLIVDITSDAWFGRSRVPALHLALARLRAVEHRRFLVHATNTGITAVVDAAGRVVSELPRHQVALGAATVRWIRDRTLYERVGDGPWWAALGGMALALGVRRRCASPGAM